MEEELTSISAVPEIKTVRDYVTKAGNIRKDKLKSIIFHDNRNGGTYNIGRNAAKRAKREDVTKK